MSLDHFAVRELKLFRQELMGLNVEDAADVDLGVTTGFGAHAVVPLLNAGDAPGGARSVLSCHLI